ncbi:transcription factor bHLH123 [Olea europaea subsp. europaea]|uniref:Transcription factor bHLH123 n=1 Tax=Olea europaea subsp. europaea TaxID=158383 RepID=A0A8S0QK82_OLEEU|nr:transcription factor bHLH123 [Olea europaea subsp. europaea]
MADEYQIGSGGNWWDKSRINRFETGSSAQKSSISTTLNSIASFGWTTGMVDDKARSSMDTGTVPGSSMVFQDSQKLQGQDQSSTGTLLADSNIHMMAFVLSEAIEYIKFLHEQVRVLSTPYMKSGSPIQLQQNSDKSKVPEQGPRQDLRSRGLCLVPISSTYPVTHESSVDFWTPTFGGTFR